MSACPACRHAVADDAKFCGECGYRLEPILLDETAPVFLLTKTKRPSQELTTAEPVLMLKRKTASPNSLKATVVDVSPLPPMAFPPTEVVGEQPRECRRYPLRVAVTYNSEHNFYKGFVENMGAGGIFVATHTPGAIGETIQLTFTVPGLEEACTAICRVQWVREFSPDMPEMVPGMGLKFLDVPGDAQKMIGAFIHHREPIFFDE